MPRYLLRILTLTFLLVAVSARAQGAHDPYLDRAGAEWDSLFNAGNYNALITLYAEDAVAFPPNAPTLSGRAAIKADFDQIGATYAAHKEMHVEEILAGENWAVERSHSVLTLIPRSGGAPITEKHRWIVCRKKIGDRWLISWEIWNADAPAK